MIDDRNGAGSACELGLVRDLFADSMAHAAGGLPRANVLEALV